MSERILVKTHVLVKELPDCEKIQHKAVAGLTDEELIERNTIGELRDTESAGDKKGTDV